MSTLSIVVPCYNEEESVLLFYKAVQEVFVKINQLWPEIHPEYWFIDDGSSYNTLTEIHHLQQNNPTQVNFISFSRNFGKEAVLYAGLTHATGSLVTVMDVDLQDPPELLISMISYIKDEHYDVVGARRVDRKGEPVIRSFFSNLFYKVINHASQTQFVSGVRDFRLMTRKVVDAILEMKEYNRFSKGIFSFVGFKTKYIDFNNRDRVAGKTHWSFKSLASYSIEGVIDFSDAPLAIASYTGLISCGIAIISLIFIVARALLFGDPTAGWPSLVSIILLIGGLQLFCLGVLGKYVGRLYLEAKHRPIYIAKEESQKM